MNNDDDFDLDNDIFDDEPNDGKVNLKKLWEDNPVFKIIVIVGAIIILYVLYAVFVAEDENVIGVSRVNQASDVTSIPGEGEVSPAFSEAIRAADEQAIQQAQQTGGSALPTPINSNEARINLPSANDTNGEDPLATWRQNSEAVEINRNSEDLTAPPVEDLPPVLDSFATQPLPVQQGQMQPVVPQQQAVDADMAGRFAEQMQVIIGTKQPQPANLITTSYPSMYEQYLQERDEAEAAAQAAMQQQYEMAQNGDFANDGTTTSSADDEVLINAGTVSYAQVINAVNSDINGPVLAHILSGPMSGGRAIGNFQLQDDYLVLTFNRVVKDDKVYGTEAYALDADTTLAGVRTDVDRHWISRVILPAAAEFIAGMGEAIAETNETTVVVDGGAAVSSESELDTQEEVARGVERGAERVSEILEEDFGDRTITVTLNKGTPIGLLFTESIYKGDAQ